jgi:hypothetical protein
MKKRVLFFLIPLITLLLLLSCTRKALPPDSGPPVIQSIDASPSIVSRGGTVSLWVSVTDPEEHTIYYEWSCPQGEFYADEALTTPSNGVNPCWWKAPETEGNFTISVTCTDSIGEGFEIVDTLIVVSVSIYSLDSVIGEDKFSSPFAMYIDEDGGLFVSDPGLTAVHYHDGARWISWNYAGLDTNIDTIVIDTVTPPDTIIDTTYARHRFTNPTAMGFDDKRNMLYLADVAWLDSLEISVYCIDSIFTPSDTLMDSLIMYGFQFRLVDRSDLNFTIREPYNILFDAANDVFYVSTQSSVISYDSTWIPDGWNRNWSFATSTQGINFKAKGMQLVNDELYLAGFYYDAGDDSAFSNIRRFSGLESYPPTEEFALFSYEDSTLQYVGGLAVGPNGHMFTTEGGGSYKSFHRVVEYNSDGTYIRSFGSPGEKEDQFNNPTDIYVDASGRIFVVDMGNHSIKVFSQ